MSWGPRYHRHHCHCTGALLFRFGLHASRDCDVSRSDPVCVFLARAGTCGAISTSPSTGVLEFAVMTVLLPEHFTGATYMPAFAGLSCSMYVAHGLGWYDGLASKLRAHAVHLPRRGQKCDLTKIAAAVQDKIIYKAMTPEPGNHLHQAYFSHKTEFRCEPYISKAKNKRLRKSIAMFRVGNHWLQVCRGRYVGLEYHQTTCPSCAGAIEHEVHAVFHCPDYNTQRQQFADLFTGQCGHDLRAFLVHNPCHRLAFVSHSMQVSRAQ